MALLVFPSKFLLIDEENCSLMRLINVPLNLTMTFGSDFYLKMGHEGLVLGK